MHGPRLQKLNDFCVNLAESQSEGDFGHLMFTSDHSSDSSSARKNDSSSCVLESSHSTRISRPVFRVPIGVRETYQHISLFVDDSPGVHIRVRKFAKVQDHDVSHLSSLLTAAPVKRRLQKGARRKEFLCRSPSGGNNAKD